MAIRTQQMRYREHKKARHPMGSLKHLLGTIKTSISKYITIEEDAIFNDPNWPYMWKHKR